MKFWIWCESTQPTCFVSVFQDGGGCVTVWGMFFLDTHSGTVRTPQLLWAVPSRQPVHPFMASSTAASGVMMHHIRKHQSSRIRFLKHDKWSDNIWMEKWGCRNLNSMGFLIKWLVSVYLTLISVSMCTIYFICESCSRRRVNSDPCCLADKRTTRTGTMRREDAKPSGLETWTVLR